MVRIRVCCLVDISLLDFNENYEIVQDNKFTYCGKKIVRNCSFFYRMDHTVWFLQYHPGISNGCYVLNYQNVHGLYFPYYQNIHCVYIPYYQIVPDCHFMCLLSRVYSINVI